MNWLKLLLSVIGVVGTILLDQRLMRGGPSACKLQHRGLWLWWGTKDMSLLSVLLLSTAVAPVAALLVMSLDDTGGTRGVWVGALAITGITALRHTLAWFGTLRRLRDENLNG